MYRRYNVVYRILYEYYNIMPSGMGNWRTAILPLLSGCPFDCFCRRKILKKKKNYIKYIKKCSKHRVESRFYFGKGVRNLFKFHFELGHLFFVLIVLRHPVPISRLSSNLLGSREKVPTRYFQIV